MTFLDKINQMDRRIIFVLIALSVFIPLLIPFSFKIQATEPVKKIYDQIEALPAGSSIVFSLSFGPSTKPELFPMVLSVLRHCFRKDLRVVFMALWPEGAKLSDEAIAQILASEEFAQKELEYGRDYVNIGYKSGGVIVLSAMHNNIFNAFPQDTRNQPLQDMEIFKGISKLEDFEMAMVFGAGDPGIPYWVMIGSDMAKIPVAAGCTGVSAPEFFPYLQTRQLIGLMGGLKGAAEYENLVGAPGSATLGMTPQTTAHLMIILFIIIGNVSYFMITRREKRKREQKLMEEK